MVSVADQPVVPPNRRHLLEIEAFRSAMEVPSRSKVKITWFSEAVRQVARSERMSR